LAGFLCLCVEAQKDKVADSYVSPEMEREFIFGLAHQLGVSSLGFFADNWQTFLTCHQLQQLITTVAPVEDEGEVVKSELAPELFPIIEDFYKSRLFHDEDSCLLLTKYFRPGDDRYAHIVATILENAEHYHAGALFHLAQLQTENQRNRKGVMDAGVFAIITKAFENLKGASSAKILDYIDWVFSACVGNRREPAKCSYYTKMIALVCQHARSDRDILLHVLQRVESQPSLKRHSTATDLGLALIVGYREHFVTRFRECGHASYAAVIAEMLCARLECRHYVKDGEVMFESEVVDVVRRSYHTKRKLMKLMSVDFPETQQKSVS